MIRLNIKPTLLGKENNLLKKDRISMQSTSLRAANPGENFRVKTPIQVGQYLQNTTLIGNTDCIACYLQCCHKKICNASACICI